MFNLAISILSPAVLFHPIRLRLPNPFLPRIILGPPLHNHRLVLADLQFGLSLPFRLILSPIAHFPILFPPIILP